MNHEPGLSPTGSPAGLPVELRRPVAPWLLRMTGTAAAAYERAWAWERAGATCKVLRGRKMLTQPGCFDELAAALQFPDYFGENWDAVDECLADLSWLPGRAYVLLVTEADQVLAHEPVERFDLLLDVFGRAAQEWATPVRAGEDWDRPAVPFHVVLHTAPDRVEALGARLGPEPVPLLRRG